MAEKLSEGQAQALLHGQVLRSIMGATGVFKTVRHKLYWNVKNKSGSVTQYTIVCAMIDDIVKNLEALEVEYRKLVDIKPKAPAEVFYD